MIPVKIAHVSFSDVMGFVVLLQSEEDNRTLPIIIGAPEAQAIAIALEKVKPPRPLTHDLMKNILDALECRLKRVEVCDLRDNTFYARLVVERNELETAIDARPSDAIALALRCGAPVFVEDSVMATAGVLLKEEGKEKKKPDLESGPADKREAVLEMLKRQIEQAVREERYEDAAVLRDKINKLTHHN